MKVGLVTTLEFGAIAPCVNRMWSVGITEESTAVLHFCILNHHCVVNTGTRVAVTVKIVFCDGAVSEIMLCYKESLWLSSLVKSSCNNNNNNEF